MLDVSHIPGSNNSTQTFYAGGTNRWQTWQKPRGAKFIQLFCVGAGGGGGGGRTNFAAGSGGGGGAGGGVTKLIIPALLIPDTLYIQIGVGGAGGANGGTGVTGGVGGISYISLAPTTTAANVLLASSTSTAGGGTGGALGAANGGAAATVFTSAAGVFSSLGIFTATAGPVGSNSGAGSTGAPGINLTALASSITSGGAGGGGIATSPGQGGSIFGASVFLTSTIVGAVTGSTPTKGQDGYTIFSPTFCSTGGAGGTSGTNLAAASGGAGGIGSGGGGAGGGTAPATGGNGGNGLVIITTIF